MIVFVWWCFLLSCMLAKTNTMYCTCVIFSQYMQARAGHQATHVCHQSAQTLSNQSRQSWSTHKCVCFGQLSFDLIWLVILLLHVYECAFPPIKLKHVLGRSHYGWYSVEGCADWSNIDSESLLGFKRRNTICDYCRLCPPRRDCACCAVLCCAVLCCAVLCCAVQYTSIHGHAPCQDLSSTVIAQHLRPQQEEKMQSFFNQM